MRLGLEKLAVRNVAWGTPRRGFFHVPHWCYDFGLFNQGVHSILIVQEYAKTTVGNPRYKKYIFR